MGDVRVSSLGFDRYRLVITGVGVRCGYDESAYVYARGPKGDWRLLFETEQNRYGDKAYAPQNFVSIDVSPANVPWTDPAPPPFVTTLGLSPWCSSNWQMIYARLWRTSPTTSDPSPLLDWNDTLYMGSDFVAGAALTANDLLIEYEGASIDAGVLIRHHVRHYLFGPGAQLRRIPPVAFNPGDFVDEWLTTTWADAAQWSDAHADKAVLANAHAALHGQLGEFDGPAKRCRNQATLWQVSFARNKNEGASLGPDRYFLVRWLAPFRFTLVRTGRAPFQGCDEVLAMPDNIETFFSQQGWTP